MHRFSTFLGAIGCFLILISWNVLVGSLQWDNWILIIGDIILFVLLSIGMTRLTVWSEKTRQKKQESVDEK
ncbi:hypothetical protein IV73_GL000845 [Weissella kandleri]|uniref:Uncharacterized protein n=1 Tax=Weissella kandleri TaxID=1616 RepID=A0A0R2JMA6_9LACO|nr:hypothetical protein [Weissella kandleri]KRN75085.1 hypothetical protein IV73_GL000845 [Weissella kandleri]